MIADNNYEHTNREASASLFLQKKMVGAAKIVPRRLFLSVVGFIPVIFAVKGKRRGRVETTDFFALRRPNGQSLSHALRANSLCTREPWCGAIADAFPLHKGAVPCLPGGGAQGANLLCLLGGGGAKHPPPMPPLMVRGGVERSETEGIRRGRYQRGSEDKLAKRMGQGSVERCFAAKSCVRISARSSWYRRCF